jgi:anti-anti-sigma factor
MFRLMTWSRGAGLLIDVSPEEDGRVTVRLAGDFDLISAEAAHEVIGPLVSSGVNVAVDMSRVTFLDAAGTRFLIESRELARAGGGDLVVCHPSRPVRRIFELTGTQWLAGPVALAAPGPEVAAWVGERAVAKVIGVGHADMANVQLVEPGSGALRIIAQEGFGHRFLDFFEVVHDKDSACGVALAEGNSVWVPDVARSPIFDGTPARDVMLDAGSRSVASVPVLADDGSLVAMISAHRREPGPWMELHRQYLEALASQTGRLLSR